MTTENLPSLQNNRYFRIFQGEPEADNVLFEGSCKHFADTYESNGDWDSILEWAKTEEFTIVSDSEPLYGTISMQLEDIQDAEETRYDADGSSSKFGCYDAGGHVVDSDRLADIADFLQDEFKYRE